MLFITRIQVSVVLNSAITTNITRSARRDLLTVRELARLQGFSDDFVFYGTEDQQREQMLRAIPPAVMQRAAKCIEQMLMKEGVLNPFPRDGSPENKKIKTEPVG